MEFKRLKNELKGISSILLGLFCLVSLITYSPQDPSIFTYSEKAVKNYGGVIGANFADILFSFFGFSAFFIPLFLIIWGLRRLLHKEGHIIYLAGSLLFLISLSVLMGLVENSFNFSTERSLGGMTGTLISGFLQSLFSTFGSFVFSFMLFIFSLIMMSPVALFSVGIKTKRSKKEEIIEEIEEQVQEEDFTPAIVTDESTREEVQYL
ncbi:MAG: DNA translocase FtsK 4TM domain-containing protein, partial [Thermodesulfovibrionales bacterium]|nr:DNA translocase FtsK 4TM domain-containing protein [Thermodesulfovibrionales bacterium]